MREVMVSNSRSPLQISVFLFGRIQLSSVYMENDLLIYLPTYRLFFYKNH